MKRFLSYILLLFLLLVQSLSGQMAHERMEVAEVKQVLRMLQSCPTFEALRDSLQKQDHYPDADQIDVMREALWQRYLYDYSKDSARMADFQQGLCRYAPGKVGRFTMKVKSAKPERGYPVYIGLHGGGGAPAEVNDEQWEQMQSYYLKAIDTGIYVAPRGPSNAWNLHFDREAEQFYNQLLAELRTMAGADPDRIYLLGYSAGGDGVYQLAPRMASQLAAASMSAGHHNGVSPVNLEHVPMLLQVGELDADYQRNRETVRYACLLDSLARIRPGAYRHQVYVHAQAEHSYVRDRQGAVYVATVLSDPGRWLADQSQNQTTTAITDAVTWLSRFRRDAYPTSLHWDAQTCLEGRSESHWVSMEPKTGTAYLPTPELHVRFVPAENRVVVERFSGPFEIHMHEAFIDSNLPLVVAVGEREFTVSLRASMAEMARGIYQHSDPNFAFWQTIHVGKDAQGSIQIR